MRRILRYILFFTGTLFITSGIFAALPAKTSLAESEPEQPPFEDTACLVCHTDSARLIELAPEAVEEDAESLSSGPG